MVLFQGDSITDAGRDKKGGSPNDAAGLGRGYPFLLGGALLADYPEKRLTVYNRGISGNKVPDLAARWQQDAIDLEPAILSILIGVNDIWHKLGGHYSGTVADYETGYRELLQRSLKELPGARIVVCEPFVLRCGAVNESWFPEFDQRRAWPGSWPRSCGLTSSPSSRCSTQRPGWLGRRTGRATESIHAGRPCTDDEDLARGCWDLVRRKGEE